MYYFTSDLHLDHKACLSFGKGRPFASIEQMNEEIMKRWNKKILPSDHVYVLGDVCWGWKSDKINNYMSKLNGYKHLIIGNHDRLTPHELSNVWVEITSYKEISVGHTPVVLFHYPIAEWNGCYYGAVHLHGHCHGQFDLTNLTKLTKHGSPLCLDVGVDTNNYEPYSWDDVKSALSMV